MPKAASSVAKSARSLVSRGRCNSFAPETRVLMGDGGTLPIAEVEVGDLVVAADPVTGEVRVEPVVDVVVGHGDKHLVQFTAEGGGPVTATANHPVWVDGRGWTAAADIGIGDRVLLPGGGTASIRHVKDLGTGRETVYNLNVSGPHTFSVVAGAVAVLVHNASAACIAANRKAGKVLEGRVERILVKKYGRANVQKQVYFKVPVLGKRFADFQVKGPRGRSWSR
nr:hypothetical protein GCM10017745_33350 [Saccharothrix mutabilis subsp. capreolus]